MWKEVNTIEARQDQHPGMREALDHVKVMASTQLSRLGRLKASPSMARSGSVLSTSTVHGTSTFAVSCSSRRWNQEMQLMCEDGKLSPLEKWEAVNQYLKEFSTAMTSLFSTFIERYLSDNPEDADLIQWASADELAMGSSITITMLDSPGSMAKEYKQQLTFLSQQLLLLPQRPYVSVFPRTLVHVRGRLAMISAELPAIGDMVDAKGCAEFRFALDIAGTAMNIGTYRKALDDGTEEAAVGPLNATARRTVDGRLYLDSFTGWFPSFPPARGVAVGADHTLLHRPEYFAHCSQVLSPGAFKVFGSRDSAGHAKTLRSISASLCQDHIPHVAGEMSLTPPKDGEDLVKTLHAHGIPLGLLPVIFVHVNSGGHVAGLNSKVKGLVMAEMVARAARAVVREMMLGRIDEGDMHNEIQTMCASVCDPERVEETWEEQLFPVLKAKYAGFASIMPPMQECLQALDTSIWLGRFAQLNGVEFADGVTNLGVSEFHFTIDCLKPVIKIFQLPQPRVGKMKFENTSTENTGCAQFNPAPSNLTPSRYLMATHKILAEDKNKDATESIGEFVSYIQKSRGVKSVEYGASLLEVAGVLTRRGQNDKAIIFYEKALEVFNSVNGDKPMRLIGRAQIGKGMVSKQNGIFRDAVKGMTQGMKMVEDGSAAVGGNTPANSNTNDPNQSLTERSFGGTGRSDVLVNEVSSGSGEKTATAATTIYCVEVLTALEALAGLYEQKGLMEEAEPLYRKALLITKSIYGPEEKNVSSALNNLACNLFAQESYFEAEQLYEEDIRITEKICEPNSLELATSLNNLAAVYDTQGRSEDALPLYQRDLQITLAALGHEHENVATSRNNLASCLLKLGKLDEAEKEYRVSLALRKKHNGEAHPSIADVLTNIGALKLGQGQPVEAKATFKAALAIYEEALGKDHHSLRRCLDHLCNLCESMQADEEAEMYSDRLMDLKRADNDIYTAQQAAAS